MLPPLPPLPSAVCADSPRSSLSIARLTGIVTGFQIALLAKRTSGRVVWLIAIVGLVRPKCDGLTVTAIQAFQLPRVDGQIIRFEIIVLANQVALFAFR